MSNSIDSPLCVADLFAGAGGLSLAAQQAGMRVVVAVEFDKWAAETYRRNFCECGNVSPPVLYEADINLLCPREIRERHFSGQIKCDILTGGPPCQGFSTHRINDSGVNDPRNELIHRYFDYVRELRPRVFLMENVPGILWDRHRDYLSQFYKEGRDAGYHLYEPVVLDARDYGLPQRRKRVFILGVDQSFNRTDFSWPPAISHGSEKERSKKPSLLPWVPCSSVFGAAHADDINNIHMRHSPEMIEVFARTPHNGGSRKDSGRVLPCHEGHNGHKDVYGRIDPSKPAPTMTTACINPSKGRFVHPTKNHGITAREAARIQTFPDHFIFCGGLMAAGKQIGNAVPVKLGETLMRHIASSLHASKVSSFQDNELSKNTLMSA